MAVSVTTKPDFSVRTTTDLFRSAHFRNNDLHNYDVSADGERFVLPEQVEGGKPVILVVLDWYEEVRDRGQN